jgi:hypothetical protein
MNSDDPLDETPICLFCDLQIGLDCDTIALQVGVKKKSEKSGRWYFMPELFDDNEEVKWFHFHCLQQTFDFSNAPNDPDDDRHCIFCEAPLCEELLYYEFALGTFGIEGADTVFEHTGHQVRGVTKTVRSYACHDCVFEGLGEGNAEMSRYILGMEGDEPAPPLGAAREIPQLRGRAPIRTKEVGTAPRRTAVR